MRRAYVELLRPANVVTAVADVLAGFAIAGLRHPDTLPWLIVSSCCLYAGGVVLNDVYSNAKEIVDDFDLPKVIATEEGCSRSEALDRTVEIHNELMHTFVAEAAALSQAGSPQLRRFLVDLWAWLGGNREWHSTTGRYQEVSA